LTELRRTRKGASECDGGMSGLKAKLIQARGCAVL
jgi:hypothetical protein